MRTFLTTLILAAGLTASGLIAQTEAPAAKPAEEAKKKANPVVVVKTSHGEFEAELFADEAPMTVENFIGLAEGTKAFKDDSGKEVKRPFYDGIKFHRIIPDFMIQGGCPKGNGMGGPGFTFKDEINPKSLGLDKLKAVEFKKDSDDIQGPHPWLLIRSQQQFSQLVTGPIFKKLGIDSQETYEAKQKEFLTALRALTLADVYLNMGYKYDDKLKSRMPKRGTLAMANSGPNTNGSQFFVNTVDNDYLTGKHTVFGKVTKGMDVVDKIGKMGDPRGTPKDGVKILSIRVKKAAEPKKN